MYRYTVKYELATGTNITTIFKSPLRSVILEGGLSVREDCREVFIPRSKG